jgi:hypothetical protein
MIWRSDISELEANNNFCDAPCYCEHLVYPSDLMLQAPVNSAATSGYTLNIYVYDATGQVQLEDVTNKFSWYIADTPVGRKIVMRLNTFTNTMCANSCFLIRVVLRSFSSTIFNSFTDVYCVASCCDVPRGITVSQDGDVVPVGVAFSPAVISISEGLPEIPTGQCGKALIRIWSQFECYDKSSGEYYGLPGSVIAGSSNNGFRYQPVTNLEGRIVRRPREITRSISFNCKLQRSESFRPYLLESFELVPSWKMDELESTFLAEKINVSDFRKEGEYQFSGGSIFTQIIGAWEAFKLSATLQDCPVRQNFGCGDSCGNGETMMMYAIPANTQGLGFYSEDKVYIAYSEAMLINWFAAQDQVTSVVDVTTDYEGYSLVLEVTGTGYLPTYIYYDYPNSAYQVYAQTEVSDQVVGCPFPVIGTVTTSPDICAQPIIGEVTTEPVVEVPLGLVYIPNWQQGALYGAFAAVLGDGWVRIDNLDAINFDYPYDPPTFPENFFANMAFAVIDPRARPSIPVNIAIDDERTFTIDENGVMYFSGPPSFEDSNVSSFVIGAGGYPTIVYAL